MDESADAKEALLRNEMRRVHPKAASGNGCITVLLLRIVEIGGITRRPRLRRLRHRRKTRRARVVVRDLEHTKSRLRTPVSLPSAVGQQLKIGHQYGGLFSSLRSSRESVSWFAAIGNRQAVLSTLSATQALPVRLSQPHPVQPQAGTRMPTQCGETAAFPFLNTTPGEIND